MNQRHLLILMAALLLIKFVIQPFLSWQIDQVDHLKLLNARFVKQQALVDSESEFLAMTESLQQNIEQVVSQLHVADRNTKLQIQKDVEQSLAKHNLSISGFNWRSNELVNQNFYQLSVEFSGRLEDIYRWQLALSKSTPIVDMPDWGLRKSRRSRAANSQTYDAKANLDIPVLLDNFIVNIDANVAGENNEI